MNASAISFSSENSMSMKRQHGILCDNTSATEVCKSTVLDLENQSGDIKESISQENEIPKNNMPVVMTGILLTTFLSALDSTIVTTAVPTIVHDLSGKVDYSWIGSAYTLALTAVLPLLGVASDMLGRKVVLYSSILCFLLGSALCGASNSMIMLVICRAVQGVGAGGITSLCFIVISDITSLANRSFYTSFIASVWGIASVIGPLLGGIICQGTTWRWIFFINLPTGGISIAILVFFLNVPVHDRTTFRHFLVTFDFIGLTTCIVGSVLILLGLSIGATNNDWVRVNVLVYIIVGVVLLIVCAFCEAKTTRNQILPTFMFDSLSKCALLFTVFLHNYNYMLFDYYLPEFYQNVKGDTPIFPAFTLLLQRFYSVGKIIALSIIYPIGSGCLFLPPLLAAQASTPVHVMAIVTSVVMFVRSIGGSVGVIVGKVVYSQTLAALLGKNANTLSNMSYEQINTFPQDERSQLLDKMGKAYRMNWIVGTIISGIGLLCLLTVRMNGASKQK
ncbi:multidrug resistance protein fnx1 [Schizosaccharomyces japonicus yFS275]|uniref:Multidrug resistance protein fnx1 n=1 Tax=Schizosaccharomyces japonicus (strain yFS275 / FY16936) TaxID=402676 RepID=B6K0E2_SCHJY|nr:multidrug resistance protein fnx1 [Schizosaccharomyces japonicus yFS275]EEB06292.2 multidrug resistance protein fnx1 [Schizosaccharomyces japonicus yFS275]